MPRFRSLPILVTALVALAGCDSPLSPSAIAGTYVLGALGTSPMPLLRGEDGHTTWWILADTVRIASDRSAEQVRVTRSFNATLQRTDTFSYVSRYTYTVRGNVVEFSIICPPTALCTPPPQMRGRFVSGVLLIDGIPTSFGHQRVR